MSYVATPTMHRSRDAGKSAGKWWQGVETPWCRPHQLHPHLTVYQHSRLQVCGEGPSAQMRSVSTQCCVSAQQLHQLLQLNHCPNIVLSTFACLFCSASAAWLRLPAALLHS